MKYKKTILSFSLFFFSCSDQKLPEKSDTFSNAIKNFEMCKTNFEVFYDEKPVVNVKNGTNQNGLAKNISNFLRDKCFDTYFGNWEGNITKINPENSIELTYIIVNNLTQSSLDLIIELNEILGIELEIKIKHPECNYIDINECLKIKKSISNDYTLVLGTNITRK